MAILPLSSGMTIEEIVPHRPSEVLSLPESAAFWVGKTALRSKMLYEGLYQAVAELRGNVYVKECKYLPPESLDDYGREADDDDGRSIHWAVVERLDGESIRVPGSMRLIIGGEANPLPIEEHFSELFSQPLTEGAAEVSRFIARHEDKDYTQHAVALALIRSVVMYAVEHSIDDFYCLIEYPLMRRLGKIGVPMCVMADPKSIPELGGDLYPIHIKPQNVSEVAFSDTETLLKTFFLGADTTKGEGFYQRDLIGGANE